MRNRKILTAVTAALLTAGAARSGMATSIPVTNGDFESPATNNFGNFSFPTPGWTDSVGGNGGVGEFIETAYGLNGNPPGSSADPDGGIQAAYIAGGGGTWMAQQIGALNPSAVYTINFSLSTDNPVGTLTTVELVDGSPTGTVLASSTGTGVPHVWSPYNPALTPVGGSSGDPLFLEFIHSGGGQSFVDGVTASFSVPEPTALGLLGIGAFGLLARARKQAQ